ncbi:hypothetical protein D3C87_1807590 [compost metagenome]
MGLAQDAAILDPPCSPRGALQGHRYSQKRSRRVLLRSGNRSFILRETVDLRRRIQQDGRGQGQDHHCNTLRFLNQVGRDLFQRRGCRRVQGWVGCALHPDFTAAGPPSCDGGPASILKQRITAQQARSLS